MTTKINIATMPLVSQILEAYSLAYRQVDTPIGGYRNLSCRVVLENNHSINVLLYKNEPSMPATIRTANKVSNFLSSKGMPARQTVDERILRLASSTRERYAVLYNYLPGQTIPWQSYSKNHIKLTGKAMSMMHAHLQAAPINEKPQSDEVLHIIRRMKRYFSRTDVQKAMRRKLGLSLPQAKLAYLEQSITLSKHLPKQHMLHMDFVRGNLLFQAIQKTGGEKDDLRLGSVEMTGIIDFEKTAYGHPVFDVARTLAFLLIDCPRYPPDKIYKYFLTSGYNKRGIAQFKAPVINYKNEVRNLLEDYMNFFLLYDLYKFLRHNPYEFLEQNHHYLQTRHTLVSRNMVKYSN